VARRLTRLFLRALKLARVSMRDVARATGRGYRSIQAVKAGEYEATPDAARDLARYLRSRGRVFSRMADALERAADQEEAQS
jgi:hypothetical protein